MFKNWPYWKGLKRGLTVGIILSVGIYPSLLIRQFAENGEVGINPLWLIGIIVLCALFGVLIEYAGKKFGKKR